MNRKLNDLPDAERSSLLRRGKGRRAATYRLDFINSVFGGTGSVSAGLTDAQKTLVGKEASWPMIKVNSGGNNSPLTGILASRLLAEEAYNKWVEELTQSGAGLRIRCIAGTDFFNSHTRWALSLAKRSENRSVGAPKILLVDPFGRAARIRSAAEEPDEWWEDSQFSRDARSSYEFLKVRASKLPSVKWADELPPSLLIWTSEYALVEPYDYGRPQEDLAVCIGRKAPILVVTGGTEYHASLMNSFDFVFEERCPVVETYELADITKKYLRRQREGTKREAPDPRKENILSRTSFGPKKGEPKNA